MVKNHFKNEQSFSFDEFHFFRGVEQERSLVNLVNQLFQQTNPGRYRGAPSTRMIYKLSRLLKHTQGKAQYEGMSFHLDQYLDEVLSIEFPFRKDLKLSLYFDNSNDNSVEDVEEAALFHLTGDNLTVFSGTISDVIGELETIL